MKKTNKPNPLKFFNNNKEMAYKKAGGEMAAYKKSLKKFQGDVTGSQVATGDDEAAKARAALAKAAALANTISMQEAAGAQNARMNNNPNSQNVDLAFNTMFSRAEDTAPLVNKLSGVREIREKFPWEKRKGGSVRRKK